ncbi:hypothetical protein BSK20_02870 [SR1 bacterium human oral taxon HOT-345]|nr:hypothetical protein BSK20_02870 [SR1 bacterium human oral taxon HOT-345]
MESVFSFLREFCFIVGAVEEIERPLFDNFPSFHRNNGEISKISFSSIDSGHMEIIKMRDNQLLIELLIKLGRSRRADLITSKSQGNRHMKKDFIFRISFVLENIVVIYLQRFLLLFHTSWSEENFCFSIEFYIGWTFKKLLPIKRLQVRSLGLSFKIFGRNLKEKERSVFYSLFNQFFINLSPV